MVHHHHIHLPPYPFGVHLITDKILGELGRLPSQGLMNLFIQHSSAALALNENADPQVRRDLEAYFERAVRERPLRQADRKKLCRSSGARSAMSCLPWQ